MAEGLRLGLTVGSSYSMAKYGSRFCHLRRSKKRLIWSHVLETQCRRGSLGFQGLGFRGLGFRGLNLAPHYDEVKQTFLVVLMIGIQ